MRTWVTVLAERWRRSTKALCVSGMVAYSVVLAVALSPAQWWVVVAVAVVLAMALGAWRGWQQAQERAAAAVPLEGEDDLLVELLITETDEGRLAWTRQPLCLSAQRTDPESGRSAIVLVTAWGVVMGDTEGRSAPLRVGQDAFGRLGTSVQTAIERDAVELRSQVMKTLLTGQ